MLISATVAHQTWDATSWALTGRKENERRGHDEHLISASPEAPPPQKRKKMRCGILFFHSHHFSTQNKHRKGGEIRLDFTKIGNDSFLLLFSYRFIWKCFWGWPFQIDFLHTARSDLMFITLRIGVKTSILLARYRKTRGLGSSESQSSMLFLTPSLKHWWHAQ